MFKSFFACMAMFTKLPFPIVTWEEKKGPLALCFLPSAGLFCGMLSYLLFLVIGHFEVSPDAGAVLLLISLYAVSGFVHIDGFMDMTDALLSARDREGKIAILKDSKVGAFSVIAVCLLLISNYAALKTLISFDADPLFLLLMPVLSRSNGAFALFACKPLSNTGILFYFRDGEKPHHKIMMLLITTALLAVMFFLGVRYLIAAVFSIILSLALALKAQKELGGINGDIIGAMIILSEAAAYLLISLLI